MRSPIPALFLVLLLSGSTLPQSPLTGGRPSPPPVPYHPERVAVKLTPGTYLARSTDPTDPAALRRAGAALGGVRLTPLFPDPGPSSPDRRPIHGVLPAEPERVRQARRARFGLDRWFLLLLEEGDEVPSAVERLAASPLVERAEPDWTGTAAGPPPRPLRSAYLPDDPRFPEQWYLEQPSDADIDMTGGWAIVRDARSVPVAVLDTGSDPEHPDLRDVLLWAYGRDFVSGEGEPLDDRGHGTHVTGLLAARADDGTGIAGTAFRTAVIPIKVLDSQLSGYYTWWASGFVYAADLGARIVCLSAGGASDGDVLHDAVAYARDRGAAVFAAMMNENSDVPYYPAAYEETIAVGATDASDRRAAPFYWWNGSGEPPGSSFGPHIDLVAPGDSLVSTLPTYLGDPYGLNGGTSMAVPLAAGIAALMLAFQPDMTPAQVRSSLREGADDQVGDPGEDEPGFDIYHGAGRLNAASSLSLAAALPPAPSDATLLPRPNPSRGTVRFPLRMASAGPVTLRIFDVRGRWVSTVAEGNLLGAGRHELLWDGRDDGGKRVPSGIYVFEVRTPGNRRTGTFTIIR
ncbi:MAG: S8 family serine peptidase [bacterium]